jgi:hypothetical protein
MAQCDGMVYFKDNFLILENYPGVSHGPKEA